MTFPSQSCDGPHRLRTAVTTKIRGSILLLTVLLGLVRPACGQADRLVPLTIPAPSLASNLLGTPSEQPVIVCLPPSYHETTDRYPVVYFLPGFTTDVTELVDGTFQGLNVLAAMDSLVAAGTIQEMIFVVANGRNVLGGSFYVNSPVTGNWEDFIVRDVVQYVDTHYRTIPDVRSRGIAGSSMGGFGALNLGMLHPDVFGAVYSLSPGLFDENGLEHQGMFVPEEKTRQHLAKQAEFDALPEDQALQSYLAFIDGLYASRMILPYLRAFAYAYGAAFAPNPACPVPHIDYPYSLDGDSLRLDARILEVYRNGFGGWPKKIEEHRDQLLALRAIAIDVGRFDGFQWIVRGSRYVSQLLTQSGVPHEFLEHDGGHEDHLRERMETHLLPFFSRHLGAGTLSVPEHH